MAPLSGLFLFIQPKQKRRIYVLDINRSYRGGNPAHQTRRSIGSGGIAGSGLEGFPARYPGPGGFARMALAQAQE
jgi:hypothetical protein